MAPDPPAKDPDAEYIERPAHRVRLPKYFIARYPVTVAQWRVYYVAVLGGAWTPRNPDASLCEQLDPRSGEGVPTHPVTNVSWCDVMAYCAWMTEQLRGSSATPEPIRTLLREGNEQCHGQPWVVSLPSEGEWEKAAYGTDGRRYPWGDQWDENRCRSATEDLASVGSFPGGASSAGAEEPVGNVNQWTRTNDVSGMRRVMRGGDFIMRSGGWYSSFHRHAEVPTYRGYSLGFRLVLVSPLVCGRRLGDAGPVPAV